MDFKKIDNPEFDYYSSGRKWKKRRLSVERFHDFQAFLPKLCESIHERLFSPFGGNHGRKPSNYRLPLIPKCCALGHKLLLGHINREGYNVFFNSQEKISQKASHVKDNDFRAITIWESCQNTDVYNDLSLLKNILNTF